MDSNVLRNPLDVLQYLASTGSSGFVTTLELLELFFQSSNFVFERLNMAHRILQSREEELPGYSINCTGINGMSIGDRVFFQKKGCRSHRKDIRLRHEFLESPVGIMTPFNGSPTLL